MNIFKFTTHFRDEVPFSDFKSPLTKLSATLNYVFTLN